MTEPDSWVEKIKEAFQKQDQKVQERYGGEKWMNKKAYGSRKFLKKLCGDPAVVLPPVVEALRSQYPVAMYLCGQDAHTLWRPISLLPLKLQDIVFRRGAS